MLSDDRSDESSGGGTMMGLGVGGEDGFDSPIVVQYSVIPMANCIEYKVWKNMK